MASLQLFTVTIISCLIVYSLQNDKKRSSQDQKSPSIQKTSKGMHNENSNEQRSNTKEGRKENKKKPIWKQKRGKKKDRSNAQNFMEASSSVDPRTGIFSFSITIGHIVTHSRRFKLKLMFSTSECGNDRWGLGTGWYFNLPWISMKGPLPVLYLGDQSKYNILRFGVKLNVPLRYYDTHNINISYHGPSTFSARSNGDLWWIGYPGAVTKFISREGYTIDFNHSHYKPLAAYNETDKVVEIKSNGNENGFFIITQTSMGTVKYEVQLTPPALRKIICHSCKGPGNTYTFYTDLMYHCGYKKIEYPSGMVEEMKYVIIGHVGVRSHFGVSKLTRYPGTNVELLDKESKTPTQIQEFDYDPYKTGHDFRGTGWAHPRTGGKDRLLEMRGEYRYWTRTKIGNTCTIYTYDKMHLMRKSVVSDCNKPKEILTQSTYEFPCVSNLPYKDMKKACPTGITYYTFPITVTNEHHGKTGVYAETTKYQYDEYANVISTTKPNGEVESVSYYVNRPQTGVYSYPRVTTKIPAKGPLTPEPYSEMRAEHFYNDLRKWKTNNEYYKVEVKKEESYVDKKGVIHGIRRDSTSYYEDNDNPLAYGRIKTRKFETADGSKSYKWSLEYNGKDGILTTIKTINDVEKEEISIDSTTGNMLTQRKVDQTETIHQYDLEGRITAKILKSSDPDDEDITTRYEYNVEKDNNRKMIYYPDGRKQLTKYDNAKNELERDVFIKNVPFPVYALVYNKLWKICAQRKHYKDKHGNIMLLLNKFKYDALGRVIEKKLPTNVIRVTIYDAYDNGQIILNYLQNGDKSTIPKCIVQKFGKEVRKGQLYIDKLESSNPCNTSDCLSVDVKHYDGFNRLITEQEFSYKNKIKQALGRTTYCAKGYVESKVTEIDDKITLNTYFEYNDLYKKKTKIKVKMGNVFKEIASREFDNYGRIIREEYEGALTENNYNKKGQLAGQKDGDVNKLMTYDGFGRLSQMLAEDLSNPDSRIIIDYNFYTNGKKKEIKTTHGYDKKKKIEHQKNYHYEKVLGLLDLYLTSTKKYDTLKSMHMRQHYNLQGRIVFERDENGFEIYYNYAQNTGELENMKIKKSGNYLYFVDLYHDEFGELYKYGFMDVRTGRGYETILVFDRYRRVEEIIYKKLPNKDRGKIHYKYDDLDQVIEKTLNNQVIETFEYDPISRLTTYECKEKTGFRPVWNCPLFTDGIKPSIRKSYLVNQRYKYETHINNIDKIESLSNLNETVIMVYQYLRTRPSELDFVVFKRYNMENVQHILKHQLYHDSQGNVVNITNWTKKTGKIVEYEIKYDGMGEIYWSTHNGRTMHKSHDEKGQMFYHRSHNNVEKFISYDDQGKLHVEWSKIQSGSYLHIKDKKAIWLNNNQVDYKYYCFDLSGSVMSSLENKKEEHFSYSPFGCNYRNATEQPIGFQNMWTDEDELIIAENGRTYAPWIGRFLQRDPESPFGESGIDSYVFAENSPVMAGDPTGYVFKIETLWTRAITGATETFTVQATLMARSAAASATTTINIARTIQMPNIVPGTLTDVRAITTQMVVEKGGRCAHAVVMESAKRFAPVGYKVNLEAFAQYPDDRVAGVGRSLLHSEMNRLWKAYGPRGHSIIRTQTINNARRPTTFFQRPNNYHTVRQMRLFNANAGIMTGTKQYVWQGAEKGFTGGGHAIMFGEKKLAMARGVPKLEIWADTLNQKLNGYFGPDMKGSYLFEKYRIFTIAEDVD